MFIARLRRALITSLLLLLSVAILGNVPLPAAAGQEPESQRRRGADPHCSPWR